MPRLKAAALLALTLAVTGTAPAGVVGWLTSRNRGWSFIQQTGGIRVGQPLEKDGKLVLPVEYDVTGTGAGVTGRPTLINSGLMVRRVKAEQTKNRELVLIVVTQVIEENSPAGRVHYADLTGLTSGPYEVYYEDAGDSGKFLGRIQVR